MNIIVAMCKNRGIGFQNKLPWNLKLDMEYFKKMTIGNENNAVVMGKNTWLSIPNRPLEKRDNIVLTNSMTKAIRSPNTYVLGNSKKSEINTEEWIKQFHYDTVWIIGGESVYNNFIDNDLVKRIYLTEIKKEYECDTFFPYLPDKFKIISCSDDIEEKGVTYNWKIYENIRYNFYDKYNTTQNFDIENEKWCEQN